MQTELFLDQTVFNDLKAEAEPYLGTLVISYKQIRLLSNIIIEPDGEPCWVFYDENGECYNDSCVLGFIPLKGKLDESDYNVLLNHWNYNSEHKAI